jgi:nicotinamide-nucleotide amidase
MLTNELRDKAADILDACRKKGLKLATAESCTGGLIAALFTDIPGSSDVFERGFVTYSNQSKTDMLGVDASLIEENGAVSEQVAAAMAKAALERAHVDIAVSVTGIAGPSGGTAEKPVGLVYIGIAAREKLAVTKNNFGGSRSEIRAKSAAKAFELIKEIFSQSFVYVA